MKSSTDGDDFGYEDGGYNGGSDYDGMSYWSGSTTLEDGSGHKAKETPFQSDDEYFYGFSSPSKGPGNGGFSSYDYGDGGSSRGDFPSGGTAPKSLNFGEPLSDAPSAPTLRSHPMAGFDETLPHRPPYQQQQAAQYGNNSDQELSHVPSKRVPPTDAWQQSASQPYHGSSGDAFPPNAYSPNGYDPYANGVIPPYQHDSNAVSNRYSEWQYANPEFARLQQQQQMDSSLSEAPGAGAVQMPYSTGLEAQHQQSLASSPPPTAMPPPMQPLPTMPPPPAVPPLQQPPLQHREPPARRQEPPPSSTTTNDLTSDINNFFERVSKSAEQAQRSFTSTWEEQRQSKSGGDDDSDGGSVTFSKGVRSGGALNPLSHWDNFRTIIPKLPKFRGFFPFSFESYGEPGKINFVDRERLDKVADFFDYSESEGRKLFEELDRDSDGKVHLRDLKDFMRKRQLPEDYAQKFLRRVQQQRRNNSYSHNSGNLFWRFKRQFEWEEFKAYLDEKEPAVLKAFRSARLNSAGGIELDAVRETLGDLGLDASHESARAMMRCMGRDDPSGHISYGEFRNFLVLLPPERLSVDPQAAWFESATMVQLAPPVVAKRGQVLKSAIAGALASGISTAGMHPLDTLKTKVQSGGKSFIALVKELPNVGARAMYAGSVPAIVGAAASHGVRTGTYEFSRQVIGTVSPNCPDALNQSISSGLGTALGTALRIPCEVLKQRVQAGRDPNARAALASATKGKGVRGLFTGTSATLAREVPFYVFGMVAYEQLKNHAKGALQRDLGPWETILVGAISGAAAAIATTPADVLKTRMMTGAAVGTLPEVVKALVAKEGVGALFKGCLPRALWIAPVGAMNFAAYELARNAMFEEP